MRSGEAMFRVLVLGGLALIAAQDACGGTTAPGNDGGNDAAQNPDSFPSELPVWVDAGVTPDATTDAADETGASDASGGGLDGFPSELPSP